MATSSGEYCPDAGDLVWIDLEPTLGHEQGGHRPAIVLTPRRYNARSGLCIMCPITSRVRGYPFEVAIPQGHAISRKAALDALDRRKAVWLEYVFCQLPCRTQCFRR